MKAHILVALSLTLLLVVTTHGQDSAVTFSTMTGLRGVAIDVAPLAPDIEDKGMTPYVIAAEVESRLKDAGIPVYPSGAPQLAPGMPTLYVEVNAVLDAYSSERCTWAVRVDLMQAVRMERNMDSDAVMASTWTTGGVSYVMKDWRQAILNDVAAQVDQFIAAFVAANPDGIEP